MSVKAVLTRSLMSGRITAKPGFHDAFIIRSRMFSGIGEQVVKKRKVLILLIHSIYDCKTRNVQYFHLFFSLYCRGKVLRRVNLSQLNKMTLEFGGKRGAERLSTRISLTTLPDAGYSVKLKS